MSSSYQLTVEEYCAEDSARSARGRLLVPVNFAKLAESARQAGEKTLQLDRLGVLLISRGNATIHIHRDGRIVINGIDGRREAEEMLDLLLDGTGRETKPQ